MILKLFVTKQQKNRALFFICLVFLWFSVTSLFANGIEVYSFTNSKGQLVVVGSLNAVPYEYREQVQIGHIKSYEPPKSPSVLFSSTPEDEGKIHFDNFTPVEMNNSELLVVDRRETNSSEEEIQIGKALSVIGQLQNILQNNKMMFALAKKFGPNNLRVKDYQLKSLNLLYRMEDIDEINFDNSENWKTEAKKAISEMKLLQSTVNKWMLEKSNALVEKFPKYLLVMEKLINGLEQEFKNSQQE